MRCNHYNYKLLPKLPIDEIITIPIDEILKHKSPVLTNLDAED